MQEITMLKKTISTASVLAFALGGGLVPDRDPPVASAAHKFVGEPKSGNDVPESRYIVVDQFGYRPDMKKVAILVDPQLGWNAKDEYVPGETLELRRFDDGVQVMSAKPVIW